MERVAFLRGYRVSPCGKIVRLEQNPPRIFQKDKGGYLLFTARSANKRTRNCSVHRLQAYQKYGEQIYQEGLQVRHLDGNNQNNSADNIVLGTPLENAHDKPPEVSIRAAAIASRAAQKHDHAKIKAFYAVTNSYKMTMRAFGISSKGTLHFIINHSESVQCVA